MAALHKQGLEMQLTNMLTVKDAFLICKEMRTGDHLPQSVTFFCKYFFCQTTLLTFI